MFLKSIVLTLLLGVFAYAMPAAGLPHDSVKGDWTGVFSIAGHTADVELKLDVKGEKVTGTLYSEHTGAGTITDGKWVGDKLTCTLVFEKHESISLSGSIKEGKLVGDFATEGMTGTWTATRKTS